MKNQKMTNTKWQEFKFAATEYKKNIERDLMIRRYYLWSQGLIPWEDKVLDNLAKFNVLFVTSWRVLVKRIMDIIASSLALVLFAPVMLAVMIAVKLTSKGPVLFKQTRVGLKGKTFDMLKFRTMVTDAEAQTGPVWAKKNDPRVTPIGLFLRTAHLDELPQFINVLRGEMSVVGPRPERPIFVEEFRKLIPHYDRRLCAKPGITGLAQIKRQYDETLADVKRKLKYNALYVQKMCPLLDVKVIALTVGTIVFRTGR